MAKFVLGVLLATLVMAGCSQQTKQTRTLILPPDATDAQLTQSLQGQTALEVLDLRESRVTDAGLAQVAGLAHLRWLNIDGLGVTDAGLQHFVGLSS